MNIEFFAMSPTYTVTQQQRPLENQSDTEPKNPIQEEYEKRFDTVEINKEKEEEKEDDKKDKTGECRTCANRKYQDGSNDPSVSFKTPTKISPDRAAAAVRNHEMEHVFHEQANAKREDREVVSQSVIYRTAICPECHRVYISGGQTRTVTRAKTNIGDIGIEKNQKGKKLDKIA